MKQTSEKVNTFVYRLTKFNKEGWADAKKHLPIPFDLVTVKTDTDRKIGAWWDNEENRWDGLHLRESDNIVSWKRRLYEHCHG